MAVTASHLTDLQILSVDISGPGVNPYSARGLRGTLAPIAMASGDDKMARTVNGSLVDISAPQMRKFRLEVSGNDQAPPALDGLWVGMLVNVDCHVELAYYTTGGSPERTPVAGSSRVEGAWTYYRPAMQMRVVEWTTETEEWNAVNSWSATFEEI